MPRISLSILFLVSAFSATHADEPDSLPSVPKGFTVDVVAKEPLVRNPCVMAFDKLGRICIGQGQQWRAPTPTTPGDRVDILIDDNGDGIADKVKTFAEGFNCIQGLAWKGRDLWVANAPDLTIVRDLDGDDVADRYVRVYTGLGNIEHSLHGLNFGPDGKLYMSHGNSKGYNRLDHLAPKAFRELWGLPSPKGAPDYTPIQVFKKGEYQRSYHTPQDDWGQQGGILRCDPDGRNLEIISRGFRNPWDITFDDGFNWLGTDNDQTTGDRIFMPFPGAHFGWGHPWSFSWTGEKHLPTVPNSAPLFEGSGTGIIHYHAKQFPPDYRNAYFINDWLRREIYVFRPTWKGALQKAKGGTTTVFAHADGGRSLPSSSGKLFEPTDIEVGPDGALYVLSWGHAYGATIKDGKQVDAGRVYRIRYKSNPLLKWSKSHRSQPHAKWTLEQLFTDLDSPVPAWRTNAQDEFLKRGNKAKAFLLKQLNQPTLTKSQETWALWTLGRLSEDDPDIDALLAKYVADPKGTENRRVQAIRILGFRSRHFAKHPPLPDVVIQQLQSKTSRLRHEAVQAIWQAKQTSCTKALLELAAQEKERITFYSTWNALRDLATVNQRTNWLKDPRAGVRLAALLGLLQENSIKASEVTVLQRDEDKRIVELAESWLTKTGGDNMIVTMSPPPGEYNEPISVRLTPVKPGSSLVYTLDGSPPAYTSPRYSGPISIAKSSKLRVAELKGVAQVGRITSAKYTINVLKPYVHRAFVNQIKAKSGNPYRMEWSGLRVGLQHYTDRQYTVTKVPEEVLHSPFLQTSNQDDRTIGESLLKLVSAEDVTVWVGVDVRVNADLDWMNIGQNGGFVDTGLKLVTTDPTFRLYKKSFPAGEIVLGGNLNRPTDSRRGNYIVILQRNLLTRAADAKPVSANKILAALKTADPERGRELFLHPRGAGCFRCHHMNGRGAKYAPDLSDIGSRVKKAEVLIESILKPSAAITEGFAQQVIATTDGKIYSGAVLEETGQSLKVVNSAGKVTTIAKTDIDTRQATKLSPMPEGFDKLMSAQQVADIVAWLMTQKKVGDPNGFSFRDTPDQLELFFGNQQIATYLKRNPKLTRSALVNIQSPGGMPITRNFPPRHPEDLDPGYRAEQGIIHPIMHPGLWLSYGDVNGNDYWRLRARVLFDRYVTPPTGDKNSGKFTVRNLYKSEDKSRTVCTETVTYRFQRVPQGIALHIGATYQSNDKDFYFGDQEESGLAVRVASPIRVQGGNGTILNDRGEKNGAGVWGKQAKWMDYSGIVDERHVGVLIVPGEKNPRPSWLHARDYGVVVVNPFSRQPKERREPYVKTWIKKGQPFRLSFAVLLYDVPAAESVNREEAVRMLRKITE